MSTWPRQRREFEAWNKEDWEATFGSEKPVDLGAQWPRGVRVAVLLTFDTQGDIDAAVPSYQGTTRWNAERINYCDLTQRQYGVRQGAQRLLRILDKYDVKGTFPTCGATAEWYPEVVLDIASRGHEIAAHAHRHIPLCELSPEEEFEEIELATRAIEKVVGERPIGWRSPMYTITEHTLDYLAELGYEYNTDFHNDDVPYFLSKGSREILEIPAGLDDWELYLMNGGSLVGMGGAPYASPSNVTDILLSEFQMLYEESRELGPRIMQYCIHPKITGRPFRAKGLEDFIKAVRSYSGVWFCTMRDLAKICTA